MKQIRGLTIIEVLVGIAILGIMSAALLAFMPVLTKNTQTATSDTVQSQQAITVFERIAYAWSNPGAWNNGTVEGTQTVQDLVAAVMGPACQSVTSSPTPERKRVVITCTRLNGEGQLVLRAEFGDPNA